MVKAKHLRHAVICSSCNEHPYVKCTPEGVWYWCLTCDAHSSACKNKGKGMSASVRCGCLT